MNRRSEITIERFLDRLKDSGIVALEELEQLATRYSDSPTDELADELLKKRVLTTFQFNELSTEEGRSLRIGDYVLVDRIGAGGMGQVFKARQKDTGKIVAIKLLSKEAMAEKSNIERFQREIDIANQLIHPNIVSTLAGGEFDGQHYLVMEFVDGHDLATLVCDSETLPISTAVDCIIHAAEALQYAHEQNIIHRDIKPSNLLLTRTGDIRVLDMGLARVSFDSTFDPSASTQNHITKTGAIMGTVDFMAPEQAINPRRADLRADIYSLGCTFYYLLVGDPLYAGETVMEVLVAHREEPIPDLAELRDDVPSALKAAFEKMVAKKPDDRFQSMAEVIDVLESCRRSNGLAWLMKQVKTKSRLR